MCDCNKENNVVLINIYLEMAEYKKNSKASYGVRLAGKESVDFRRELSQEELAYAYEVLNITDWIDKTDKVNEKSTSKKSTTKKAATTITKNSEEE
tara:strand:- start:28 stop:315 length:288 start_codon:yes stop_codon:yes gene_type:complete